MRACVRAWVHACVCVKAREELNFKEEKPSGLAALGAVRKGRKVLCVQEAQQGSHPVPRGWPRVSVLMTRPFLCSPRFPGK